MSTDWLADVRWSYDGVAEDYHRYVEGLLDELPLERAVLQVFTEMVGPAGRVADLGCGTGRVARHLTAAGLRVAGADISAGMVRTAHRAYPGLPCLVAPLHRLPLATGALDGALCWYVLQHLPDSALDAALAELRRVLRPGGTALVGFHTGSGTHSKTEGYGGHPMRVHVHRRNVADVAERLSRNGFEVSAEVRARPSAETGASGGGYVVAVASGKGTA